MAELAGCSFCLHSALAARAVARMHDTSNALSGRLIRASPSAGDGVPLDGARGPAGSIESGFPAARRCPKPLRPGVSHPGRTSPGVLPRNPSGEAPLLRIIGTRTFQAIWRQKGDQDRRKLQPPGARKQPRDCLTRHSSPGKSRRPLRPRKPRARQPIEDGGE